MVGVLGGGETKLGCKTQSQNERVMGCDPSENGKKQRMIIFSYKKRKAKKTLLSATIHQISRWRVTSDITLLKDTGQVA